VVVIGGGIAGLAAAWELSGGADGPAADTPDVHLLEAGDVLGGKLRTVELAGRPVDTGPDGFLGRRDEAAALAREVGLGEQLRPVGASGASVWARHAARPLADGLALGVPTRFWPVARSGILDLRGLARLAVDVVAPRADRRNPLGDRAVGPLIARKLGHEVVERLADPMIGGIHAGSVSDMSAGAVFPTLLAVAQRRGSFMKALRRTMVTEAAARSALGEPVTPAPLFWALEGGVATLPTRLAEALTQRGATVSTGRPVAGLHRGGAGWVVDTPAGPFEADGVVLATPAPTTAALLEPHDADAAKLLRDIDYASVTLVTLVYPADAVPPDLYGTGLLVPRGTVLRHPRRAAAEEPAAPDGQRHDGGRHDGGRHEPALVSACTYLSQKWPHVARPGDVLLRASVGRMGDDRHLGLDDDQLTARVTDELGRLVGEHGTPTTTLVTRWHEALPQYRVNHLLRVTGVESAVSRLGPLAVAGAAYRGVGIPACVASGRSAARSVLDALRAR
jgi:oxygen-dependent protoporphyrinogen oxidase